MPAALAGHGRQGRNLLWPLRPAGQGGLTWFGAGRCRPAPQFRDNRRQAPCRTVHVTISGLSMCACSKMHAPILFAHVVSAAGIVVLADTVFTATAALLQPQTGHVLARRAGRPLTEGWPGRSLVAGLPIPGFRGGSGHPLADAAQAGSGIAERKIHLRNSAKLFRRSEPPIRDRHPFWPKMRSQGVWCTCCSAVQRHLSTRHTGCCPKKT
ncbi:MAG: DUF2269 family protein [Jhaorihella sp.]